MSTLSLNYNNTLQINVNPSGVASWATIADGFNNLTDALNEVLFQASFLNDAGWGSTEVTGMQYMLTLTGIRKFGDVAQDYIYSDAVRLASGAARKTQLRITSGNLAILEWDITLANINSAKGDANQPEAISIVVHGNGAPTILTGVYLNLLTVVSVAGTGTGNTAVYVNPAVTALHSYKYKTGASVDLPEFDDVLTTGWTAWNGIVNIAATTGNEIVIAEILTADNKAKKAGKAIVTSAT